MWADVPIEGSSGGTDFEATIQTIEQTENSCPFT